MTNETRTLTCTYIGTYAPDYLTDHHNRENELLIEANPSPNASEVITSFWEYVNMCGDKIPKHISNGQIICAIRNMVARLSEYDIYPDIELDMDECDPCSDGIYIYAYLSW